MHAISLNAFDYRPTALRESCTHCGVVHNTGRLLRQADGPVCLQCDAEKYQVRQTSRARRKIGIPVLISAVLVASAVAVPVLLVIGSLSVTHVALFLSGSSVAFSLCSVCIYETLRELRYDLPRRDPIVLAKHMFSLSFATVTNAIAVWIFVSALLLG